MPLIHLACEGFRNLSAQTLNFSTDYNLITGANGSGKTSLLEAIYFLGRLRSFRTHQLDNLIQTSADHFQLTGKILTPQARPVPVGVRRTRKHQEIRLDGQPLKNLASLVSKLPIQLIEPDSHRLLDGGPARRRQFLDWGVFHVEQAFYPVWQQYARALKQRNAILKTAQPVEQIQLWDKPLSEAGARITELRTLYLGQLNTYIGENLTQLIDLDEIAIRYKPGWPNDRGLEEALSSSLEQDRRQGFTRYGPHRADLQILVAGQPAEEHLSRGQQKQLITALLLAQAQHYQQLTGQHCLFLVDDLPSELDEAHRTRLLDCLRQQPSQLFVTSTSAQLIPHIEWQDPKVFHVEHGKVSEMVY